MKPLIVYHADCTDGYGSAFVAWLHYRDSAEYLAIAPNQLASLKALESLPQLVGRDVTLIDVGAGPEVVWALHERCHRVVMLDHHATIVAAWAEEGAGKSGTEPFVFPLPPKSQAAAAGVVRLDTRKSGALLAWEYYFPDGALPRLIAYIDDYDRWALKLPHSLEFNLALRNRMPWSFEKWEELFGLLGTHEGQNSGTFESMLHEGLVLRRAQLMNAEEIARNAVTCHIDGWEDVGLAVCCPMLFANDVGEILARRSNTFAICWYGLPNGKIKCSLRAIPGYDVRRLAELHGGGGHPNSAAFTSSMSSLSLWLKPEHAVLG